MRLSALETMTSCMVPLAAWRIGSLGSSGFQREHWTYRFGHTTPESHVLLRLLSLLLALSSAFSYSAARGAGGRGASPQVIREHLADLLGVEAQQLLVHGSSYPLPCLELVRLKLVDLLGLVGLLEHCFKGLLGHCVVGGVGHALCHCRPHVWLSSSAVERGEFVDFDGSRIMPQVMQIDTLIRG